MIVRQADTPEIQNRCATIVPEIQLRPGYRAKTADKAVTNFIAEIEGKTVGFLIGYDEPDGYFYNYLFGVVPEARKEGVAQAIFDHVEQWAKKNGHCGIRVQTRNRFSAMLHLLIKNQYKIVSFIARQKIDSSPIRFEKRFDANYDTLTTRTVVPETYAYQIRLTGVLIENDRLLLVKQNQDYSDREWSLPGGRLEAGEVIETAVPREIKEESGLDVSINKLLYICDVPGTRLPVVHLTFLLDRIGGEITMPTNEVDENTIFDVQMAPLDQLESFGFTSKFEALVRAGFPDAGRYAGTKAAIGLDR